MSVIQTDIKSYVSIQTWSFNFFKVNNFNIAWNICKSSKCSKEQHHLLKQASQTKRNNNCCQVILCLEEDIWCLGVRLCGTVLWGNQIIFMTDFCPGISELLKQHLRRCTMTLVHWWIVHLSSQIICSCVQTKLHIFLLCIEILFHLSCVHTFLCTDWHFHQVFLMQYYKILIKYIDGLVTDRLVC